MKVKHRLVKLFSYLLLMESMINYGKFFTYFCLLKFKDLLQASHGILWKRVIHSLLWLLKER